ncbi:MAG: hypothetical protein ACQCXQ_11875, partial [Verrucomicrobiales bacterium]
GSEGAEQRLPEARLQCLAWQGLKFSQGEGHEDGSSWGEAAGWEKTANAGGFHDAYHYELRQEMSRNAESWFRCDW